MLDSLVNLGYTIDRAVKGANLRGNELERMKQTLKQPADLLVSAVIGDKVDTGRALKELKRLLNDLENEELKTVIASAITQIEQAKAKLSE